MKRTPWFSAITQSPIRIGQYEYRGPCLGSRRLYWDGTHWGFWDEKKAGVWVIRVDISDQWRGLTERAK